MKDIKRIIDELNKIQDKNEYKLLLPIDVINTARDKKNYLHSFFEWDNDRAGEQWRIEQARRLIRQVRIINPEVLNAPPIPVFVSLINDRKDGGYRKSEDVIESDELKAELLRTAELELRAWIKRYQMLKELVEKVVITTGIGLDILESATSQFTGQGVSPQA